MDPTEMLISGGAEISAVSSLRKLPNKIKVTGIPPATLFNPDQFDGFLLNNTTMYGPEMMQMLKGKPVIKVLHDNWETEYPINRTWMINNAHLFYSSPLHLDILKRWNLDLSRMSMVPQPIDYVEMYNLKQKGSSQRVPYTYMWAGRYVSGKGFDQTRRWAIQRGIDQVDCFGSRPYKVPVTLKPPMIDKGVVPWSTLMERMLMYENLVFHPEVPEPFGRVVAEAYLMGMKIYTNEKVGAIYWINERPHDLRNSITLFWNQVYEVIKEWPNRKNK